MIVPSSSAEAMEFPLGGDAYAESTRRVTLKRAALFAGAGVPQLQRVIATGGDQQLAVGKECDATDNQGMPKQGQLLATGSHVPQPYGCVATGRGQRSAPSGEKARPLIESAWPTSLVRSFPLATSQSLAVLSLLAVASRRSGR